MSTETVAKPDVSDKVEALVSCFTDTEKNLEILAEEAAEVIQSKSKLIRFGLEHKHHETGERAMLCLEQEVGDFLAMVDVLEYQGHFNSERIEAAKLRKLEKLKNWYS